MARYKEMSAKQEIERDDNMEELKSILNDAGRSVSCMRLSRMTGIAYNTILKIKNHENMPNSHYTISRKLLKAVNSPYF